MKTSLRTLSLLLGLGLSAAATARASLPPSPFGVAATMETRDGAPVVRFSFEVPAEHTLYAARLGFETADGQSLTPLTMPEPAVHTNLETGETKNVYERSFAAEFKLDAPLPAGLVVRLQGCSNAACYFPERRIFKFTDAGLVAQAPAPAPSDPDNNADATAVASTGWQEGAGHFKVVARETGYVSKGDFLNFLQAAKAGRSLAGGAMGRLQDLGLLATLAVIVLGGLGLNLTPCVLPLIPINLAIIGAGAQSSSRRRGFTLGAIYGGGMALVYGALGLVVVLTGSKFGALNSSIWFNLVIALIFVVMGLAMFDLVNVDFSRFQGGGGKSGKSQKSQFVLAFSMGVVAALMAGACVAPVVISVLLLAAQLYGKGMVAGLALPFLLGLGMALPWPFAGAGLSFLPKPGKWMKWVKYSFGSLILLFALYYGNLAGHLFMTRHGLVASARTTAANGSPAPAPDAALSHALQDARAQGKPVFIDFAASWCKNCEAMDATVFRAQEVKDCLKDFVVVKYDAEQPNESPAKEVLDRFGVIGLPTYVVLMPEQ